MALTLHDVVQAYLADTSYQENYQQDRATRDATVPKFRDIISRFTSGETDLLTFRTQLGSHTRELKYWGAQGPGFMMEINKLSKYHDESGPIAQEALRQVLTGLNSSNLGERLETFYNFLLTERGRLLHEGKPSNNIVAARKSAFILSLFAYWFTPDDRSFAYYDSLRKGLFTLIKADLLPVPPHIHLGPNAVEILSSADHDACLALISDLTS